MDFFYGIKYNIQGVFFAAKHPRLLWLGLLRFVIVLILALLFSGMIFFWHDAILSLIWEMPKNGLLVYVWHLVSWVLSLLLAGVAVVVAYLTAQLFFGVFIMDYMSRVTEKIVLGKEISYADTSLLPFFVYLVGQEIPRAIIPVVITLAVTVLGLFTPLGPVILVLSAVTAGVFLAWDNTDLVPARKMMPFKDRLQFLWHTVWFHMGFGVLFLIPWVNIVLLSFAPVGATLYHIHKNR
ncbi:MAG: EI24 domain-containing protein [Desulfotignum sp.]|nr:EI24 domain-containing protein [Desulfotignum sp.]